MTDAPMKTHPIPPASGEAAQFYPVKAAIERAMQDERDGKPCGCIIESGCEARGYDDPSYAASGFIWQATEAAILAALRPSDSVIQDSWTTEIPAVVGEGEPVFQVRLNSTGHWQDVAEENVRSWTDSGCEVRKLYATPASQDALIARADYHALYRAYVGLLEAGRDRIISFAGSCDDVPTMEENDPALRKARALLADLDAGAGT